MVTGPGKSDPRLSGQARIKSKLLIKTLAEAAVCFHIFFNLMVPYK